MISRAFAWVRDNWYPRILPTAGAVGAIGGALEDNHRLIGLGALVVAVSCWNMLMDMRERDDGR